MKKYRVKEKFLVTQWTYIKANSPEEALEELSEYGGDWSEEIDSEWVKTLDNTIEEIEK